MKVARSISLLSRLMKERRRRLISGGGEAAGALGDLKSAAATAAEETGRPAPDLVLRWRRRRAAVDERIEASKFKWEEGRL